MKQFNHVWHSLSMQLTLAMIGIIGLTVIVSWFPELRLIRKEFDRRTNTQIEQAQHTAIMLFAQQESTLGTLADLIVQLSELRAQFLQSKNEGLATYLHRLGIQLDLDLLLVCDASGQIVAQSDIPPMADPCFNYSSGGMHVLPGEPVPQVWWFATRTVGDERSSLGSLTAGVALDNQFVARMRTLTGVDYTIWVDDVAVATSLPSAPAADSISSHKLLSLSRQNPSDGLRPDGLEHRVSFFLGGDFYHASTAPWLPPQLMAEVIIDVADVTGMEWWLLRSQVAGLLTALLAGTVVAVVLAQRIGHSLSNLASAAARFSRGDFESPVKVQGHVQEVQQMAQALEQARKDMRHMLTELQREKAWVDQLLQAIVEGIVTIDEQDNITFWSQGAERITGWPREAVLDRNCNDLFQPVATQASFMQLIADGGNRGKITVKLADGNQAILSVTKTKLALTDQTSAAEVLLFRDISEEEAVQRLLGHFMANITHEFRTPLSALAAAIELLRDHVGRAPHEQITNLAQEELQELLLSLHLGILGLQTLVDNLLESASLESGVFQAFPRPVDLGELIDEAQKTMQPLLAKYEQQIVLDLPTSIPLVQADPRRTIQVLVNLISNAGKYGPADAEVVIGAEFRAREVCVTVADQGVGIPATQRSAIFDRFIHFNSNDDVSRYGTGLGLWVVKSIVQAQGGEAGVRARPGGGSVFWFTVRIAEEQ